MKALCPYYGPFKVRQERLCELQLIGTVVMGANGLYVLLRAVQIHLLMKGSSGILLVVESCLSMGIWGIVKIIVALLNEPISHVISLWNAVPCPH